MPNLQSLVESGVSGSLSGPPLEDPTPLWNCAMTGRPVYQHGVLHSAVPGPAAEPGKPESGRRPVGAGMRRCPTLWELAAAAGHRSFAVGWPATCGTELGEGMPLTVVSDRFVEPQAPAGALVPASLETEFSPYRLHPQAMDQGMLAQVLPRWREVDQQRDPHLAALCITLAAELSLHAAMGALMERAPWDLAAVRYPGLARIWRDFGKFRAEHPQIPAQMRELYSQVLENYARLWDRQLGRLLELVGSTGETLVALASPAQGGTQGVVVLHGPGVPADDLLHGADVLDLAPTLLAALGLDPRAEGLSGRVLVDGWPVKERAALEKEFAPVTEALDTGEDVALHQMMEWTLARAYQHADREAEAEPILGRLFRADPSQAGWVVTYFHCQVSLGHVGEGQAPATLQVLLDLLGQAHEAALPLRAELALAQKDFPAATELLRQAEATVPQRPEPWRQIALGWFTLRVWPSLGRCAQECLRRNPNDAHAWLGLGEALLRRGDAEEALKVARKSLALNFAFPDAHLLAARALAQLDRREEARETLSTLLSLHPEHRAARRYLGRLRLN